MRRSYDVFFADSSWASGPDHHSADLIAIHVAVVGPEPYFVETTDGYNDIHPDGTMHWRIDRDVPGRSYVADLKPGVDGRDVGRAFESLIEQAQP